MQRILFSPTSINPRELPAGPLVSALQLVGRCLAQPAYFESVSRNVPRGPQTFKQVDVTKAIKAAVKAGLPVGRVEISPDGRIIVIAGKPVEGQNSDTEANEWDSVT